jgi:uncharacterized protein
VGCSYCYHEEMWAENPQLRALPKEIDIDKVIMGWKRLRVLHNEPAHATFHGGEPLTIPLPTLREIMERLKAEGCNRLTIQTSTYGMTDEHVALFKQFNVGIGVSFDGPWYTGCPDCQTSLEPAQPETTVMCPTCKKEVVAYEYDLNRGRGWITAPAAQKEFANKIAYWIDRMHEEGIGVGTITVVNCYNAADDRRLKALIKWYVERPWLSARFNPVHTEQAELKFMELDEDRLADVYLQLADACLDNRLHWLPIRDHINMLLGIAIDPCWHGSLCDPFNSVGAAFVNETGEDLSVCPKLSTVFDVPLQISATSPSKPNPWRPTLLKEIPFGMGGCKGCRYSVICQGGCPSDGIDGDIRNRTRFCKYLYVLWAYLEKRLKDMIPGLDTLADLPLAEQEKLFRQITTSAFANYRLFQNVVRTEADKYKRLDPNSLDHIQRYHKPNRKGVELLWAKTS